MPTAVTVGRIRPGDHLCLSYDTDAERQEVLTSYLLDGLARGEKIIYLTDGTTADSITGWLRATDSGLDTDTAWGRGQVEMRQVEEMYRPDGRFDLEATTEIMRAELTAARTAGFRGLRFTGEMSGALRGVPGATRLVELEAKLQVLIDAGGLTGLCQYDQRVFETVAAVRALDTHRGRAEPNPLYDDGALCVTPMFRPAGLRLIGTVDISTAGGLATALRQWTTAMPGDVHLDVSLLRFIDVAGLRLLVRTAHGLHGAKGHSLHVTRLDPELREVVRIIGWDQTPGLVFTLAGVCS